MADRLPPDASNYNSHSATRKVKSESDLKRTATPFQVVQPRAHERPLEALPIFSGTANAASLSENIQQQPPLSAQPDFATSSAMSQRGTAIDELLLQSENIHAAEVNPTVGNFVESAEIRPTAANSDELIRLDSAGGNPQREVTGGPNENDEHEAAPHGRESGDKAREDAPVTELDLGPQLTPKREIRDYWWAITLALATLLVAGFTEFYAYNASLSRDPFTQLLANSSDNTTFAILFLVQVTIVCLNELVSVTLQHLRWSWVSCDTGINFISFLTLNPGLSPVILLYLLFSPLAIPIRLLIIRLLKCWGKEPPGHSRQSRGKNPPDHGGKTIPLRTKLDQSVLALALQRYKMRHTRL
jgi:hypothetical protein